MTQKITKETKEKLQAELENLKSVRKIEATESLKKAIAEGDITESSDYEVAKDELLLIDAKIAEITEKLANAEIVEYKHGGIPSEVKLGSTVTIENMSDSSTQVYSIVLPDDIDLSAGKISERSPVGSQLLDRKVGDIIVVSTPGGEVKYTIKSIS